MSFFWALIIWAAEKQLKISQRATNLFFSFDGHSQVRQMVPFSLFLPPQDIFNLLATRFSHHLFESG